MSLDIEAGISSPATNPINEEEVPRSAPEASNLPPPPEPEGNFTDGSDPLFSMYNETVAKQDQTMAEIWKSDIDSALVVTGLFSIMVATLLTRSYQDLKFNSQDASAFYLSQIYRINAGQSGSTAPLPVTVPNPSTYSPATSVVWANALWSLSLVISIACTLFATLLQQWARRYLHTTQEPRGPRVRARIRVLMVRGIERLQLSQVAPLLPALFHLSIFLFLAGFVIFLFHVNHAISWVILGSVAACAALYLYASVVPILKYDSPCYTPLFSLMSTSLWLAFKFLYHLSRRLGFIGSDIRLRMLAYTRGLHRWTLGNMPKDVEDLARTHSSVLDTSVILRTFDSLDGDKDMEKFLACIPGFYRSSEVKKDVPALEKFNGKRFPPAVVLFLNRSLSSELLTEIQKERRIAICLDAMTADPLILQCAFRQVLLIPESLIFNRLDFVRLAQSQAKNNDPWVKDYAQCIVAIGINRIHDYNDDWAVIVRQHLGLSEVRLREYRGQGDHHSVQLRNLICTTKLLMASQLKDSDQFNRGGVWRNVLMEVCKLEIQTTEPELQHEFCKLWNELKGMASDRQASHMVRSNATHILSIIRNLYIPIHQSTTSAPIKFSADTNDQNPVLRDPSSYPDCLVPSHHSDPPDLDPAAIASTSAEESTHISQPITFPQSTLPTQIEPTRDQSLPSVGA